MSQAVEERFSWRVLLAKMLMQARRVSPARSGFGHSALLPNKLLKPTFLPPASCLSCPGSSWARPRLNAGVGHVE